MVGHAKVTAVGGVADEPTRFQISTLMEEAYESSVIEGAVSTREAARSLLRENRAPVSHDERMIVNNYRAMEMICRWVEEDPNRSLPLTEDRLMNLHHNNSKLHR